MCDNVDCKNINPIIHHKVKLRAEFENDTCRWCLDCINRDNDMIEEIVRQEATIKNTTGTVQYDVYNGMIHFLTDGNGFECFLGDFLKDFKNKKVAIEIRIKELE